MKSNKALARKILCGLLAAGVVGVSGSALAADYDNFYYGIQAITILTKEGLFVQMWLVQKFQSVQAIFAYC